MSKLLPGENLVLKDHPHWITVVKTVPIPIVLVILVLWADFTVLLDNYRVQDCTTNQSLVGRVLGYGRVEVDAAGAQGAEVLDHLPQPGDFRDQVFVQSEKRRGGALPAVPSATPVPANPSGV